MHCKRQNINSTVEKDACNVLRPKIVKYDTYKLSVYVDDSHSADCGLQECQIPCMHFWFQRIAIRIVAGSYFCTAAAKMASHL